MLLLLIPLVISMDKPDAEPDTTLAKFLNNQWDACNADSSTPECKGYRQQWEDKVFAGQKNLAANWSRWNVSVSAALPQQLAGLQKNIDSMNHVLFGVPQEVTGLIEIVDNLATLLLVMKQGLANNTGNYTAEVAAFSGSAQQGISLISDSVASRLGQINQATERASSLQMSAQANQYSQVAQAAGAALGDLGNQVNAMNAGFNKRIDDASATGVGQLNNIATGVVGQVTDAAKIAKTAISAVTVGKAVMTQALSDMMAQVKMMKTSLVDAARQGVAIAGASAEDALQGSLALSSAALADQASNVAGDVANLISAMTKNASQLAVAVREMSERADDHVADYLEFSSGNLSDFGVSANTSYAAQAKLVDELSARISGLEKLVTGSSTTAHSGYTTAQTLLASLGNSTKSQLIEIFASLAGDVAGQMSTHASNYANLISAHNAGNLEIATMTKQKLTDLKLSGSTAQLQALNNTGKTSNATDAALALALAHIDAEQDGVDTRTSVLAGTAGGALDDAATTVAGLALGQSAEAFNYRQGLFGRAKSAEDKINADLNDQESAGNNFIANSRRLLFHQAQAATGRNFQVSRATAALSASSVEVDKNAEKIRNRLTQNRAEAEISASGISTLLATLTNSAIISAQSTNSAAASEVSSSLSSAIAADLLDAGNLKSTLSDGLSEATSAGQVAQESAKASELSMQHGLSVAVADARNLSNALRSPLKPESLTAVMAAEANAASANQTTFATRLVQDSQNSAAAFASLALAQAAINQNKSTLSVDELFRVIDRYQGAVYPEGLDLALMLASAFSGIFMKDSVLSQNVSDVNADAAQLSATAKNESSRQIQALQTFRDALATWKFKLSNESNAATAAMHAEMTNIPVIISSSFGNFSGGISANVSDLSFYLAKLSDAFSSQFQGEADFAQNIYLQLSSAISGVSQDTLKARAAFLAKLYTANGGTLSASQAMTNILATLSNALSEARDSGLSDMSSLTQQLRAGNLSLADATAAVKNEFSAGLGFLTAQNLDANLQNFRNVFTNAAKRQSEISNFGDHLDTLIDLISSGAQASDLEIASTNNGVLGLASEINSLDSTSRNKILSLLRQVQSGNLTMEAAISSAREVNAAKIRTMADAITAMNSVISAYITDTQDNYQDLNATLRGFRLYGQAMIGDLSGTAAAILADVQPNVEVLKVKDQLLVNLTNQYLEISPGMITNAENSSISAIDAMEAQARNLSDMVDAAVLAVAERDKGSAATVDRVIKQEQAKLSQRLAAIKPVVSVSTKAVNPANPPSIGNRGKHSLSFFRVA